MAEKANKKFKFQLPHVITLIFFLIVLVAILTWIVPSGAFQREVVSTAAGDREVAIAGILEIPLLVGAAIAVPQDDLPARAKRPVLHVEMHLVVGGIAVHHEAYLQQLVLEGFYAVGLLDAERAEALKVEGDAFQHASQDKGLGQVGLTDETVFQSWQGDVVATEGDGGGHAFLGTVESGPHPEHAEEIAHHRVALS